MFLPERMAGFDKGNRAA